LTRTPAGERRQTHRETATRPPHRGIRLWPGGAESVSFALRVAEPTGRRRPNLCGCRRCSHRRLPHPGGGPSDVGRSSRAPKEGSGKTSHTNHAPRETCDRPSLARARCRQGALAGRDAEDVAGSGHRRNTSVCRARERRRGKALLRTFRVCPSPNRPYASFRFAQRRSAHARRMKKRVKGKKKKGVLVCTKTPF